MKSSKRFFIYGIGFFLGCVIVFGVQSRKAKAKEGLQEPGQTRVFRQLPLGEVVRYPRPLDPVLALFYNEEELPDGTMRRVLVFDNSGPITPTRVEECLRISAPGKAELLSRKVMAADQLLLSLKPGATPEDCLPALKKIGAAFVAPSEVGQQGGLVVQLPSFSLHALEHYSELLKKNSIAIESVEPHLVRGPS